MELVTEGNNDAPAILTCVSLMLARTWPGAYLVLEIQACVYTEQHVLIPTDD